MMKSNINEFSFLRICSDIAKNKINKSDISSLYKDLELSAGRNYELSSLFGGDDVSLLQKSRAIDGIAHAIHCQGEDLFKQVFDENASFNFFKDELDSLSGFDVTCEIRKSNRGYFTSFFDDSAFLFLEKADVGRIKGDDISEELKEYITYLDAGIATAAEVLTLNRAYPKNKRYKEEVLKRDISDNFPMVVGGPASVEIIDKQKHLVTTEALDEAFTIFMKNPRTRNIQVLHTNFQVGWPLPVYINSEGKIFRSGVDEKGLWLIVELRDDLVVSKKIKEQIEKGVIKSYSIAGTATKKQEVKRNESDSYIQIDGLELAEITLCYDGANQQANFDIIKSFDDEDDEQTDFPPTIMIQDPPSAFGSDDCECDGEKVEKATISFNSNSASIFEKILQENDIIKGDNMPKSEKIKAFTDWTKAENKRREDAEERQRNIYGWPDKSEYKTEELDPTRYSKEKPARNIKEPQRPTSG